MDKVCTGCGKRKPLTEFHKNKKTSDGLQVYCKTCNIEKVASYQKKKEPAPKFTLSAYLTYYGAVLRSTGSKWQEVADEVNRLLVKEGKSELALKSIQARIYDFMKKEGKTFGAEVIPFLQTLDEEKVTDYMLGNLIVEFEAAKANKDSKKATQLSSKIMDLIYKRHQMRKTEETEGYDSFSELITKVVSVAN